MENSAATFLKPIMPIGGIILWSGNGNSFDESGKGTGSMNGWAICNGNNNTPDLRDSFIVGAGNKYVPNATGGEASVTLTVDQIPNHIHKIHDGKFGNIGTSVDLDAGKDYIPYSMNNFFGTGATDGAGGGQGHNNLPPYYALYYIMKIA